jgi:biotin transport system substrate-specific component
MTKAAVQAVESSTKVLDLAQQAAIVLAASLFIAVCARVTVPLPFTPIPLTLQNFGVLLVGLTLGSRRGFAALVLYLIEGGSGMPVFNPAGLGGVAQLFGPTGGYLLAYPVVAGLAGWIFERGNKSFARGAAAGTMGEIVLFASGIAWLSFYTHSFAQAFRFGFYWFIFAEIIKVMFAAAIASGWQRFYQQH